MPPTREYTPARRKLMQSILGLVLASSVGLAALVDRQLLAARRALLGSERSAGPLHFRSPANWSSRPLPPDAIDSPVFEFAAPDDSATGGRILRVYSQRLRRPIPPEQYLDRSHLLDDLSRNADFNVEPATLAGRPAVLVEAQLELTDNPDPDNPEVMQSELILCGILDSRQAVTLRLSEDGKMTAADRVLLNSVASTVRVDNTQ